MNERSWVSDGTTLRLFSQSGDETFKFSGTESPGTYTGTFLGDGTPHLLRPLGQFAQFTRGPLTKATSAYDEAKAFAAQGDDFSVIVAPSTRVATPTRGLWFDGLNDLPGRTQNFITDHYYSDPVFYHVLFDAILYNGTLVQTRNGDVIFESGYQTELRSRSLKYGALEHDGGAFLPHFDELTTKSGVWFLFNNMLGNFGHFHVQSLSTVDILDSCQTMFREPISGIVSTSVPRRTPEEHEEPFRLEAYDRFSIDRKSVWNPLLEDGVAYKFDVLVVPSTHRIDERLAFNPYQINVLRSRLVSNTQIKPGKRVLLSRADVGNRRSVANFDELEAALRPLGFEPLVIGSIPYHEQLTVLADAEAVIGAHGGNLTNILSHPGRLKLLELFHSSQLNGWFKHISALCNADYYSYCVDPIDRDWYSSFVVDPSLVAKCARRMINE